MIDLLFLAPEPIKLATIDEASKSKGFLFKEILLRLQERNFLNDIAIKKHIRKSKKRKMNDTEIFKNFHYESYHPAEERARETSMKHEEKEILV